MMSLDRLVKIDSLVYVLGNELEFRLLDGLVATVNLEVVGIALASKPLQVNGRVLLCGLQRIHLDNVVEVEIRTCTKRFGGGLGTIFGKAYAEFRTAALQHDTEAIVDAGRGELQRCAACLALAFRDGVLLGIAKLAAHVFVGVQLHLGCVVPDIGARSFYVI